MKQANKLQLPKQWPALVLALLIQAAGIVWWASARERDNYFLAQRVGTLETKMSRDTDAQAQIVERLARIEERLGAQLGILDRIEKQISINGRDWR